MLELVDVEFVRLRDDLGDYAKDVARRIASNPGSVEVDQASLIAYIKKDALVKRLDKQISASAAIPLRGQPRLGWMVKAVRYHGIETIGDLQQLLQKWGSEAVDLEAESAKDDPLSYVSMRRGFSLGCLFNYLAAMKGSEQAYLDYLEHIWGADADESPFESNSERAKRMVGAYQRMIDPFRGH
jgi:hypothetical protein